MRHRSDWALLNINSKKFSSYHTIADSIPLKDILASDTRFRCSFPPSISSQLYMSIKTLGIMHPIICRTFPSSRTVQIISGFRRFNAAKKLKLSHIPAYVYPHKELTDKKAMVLIIHDNLTSRGFNIIEIARLLRALSSKSAFSEKEVISRFLPLLSLEPNRCIFERMIKLCSLKLPGQHLLAEGKISLQTAELILHVPSRERDIICTVLHKLKTGRNKSHDIVTLLYDISKREHISIQTLIQERFMQDILTAKNSSPPIMFHAMKSYLFNRRYPQLSKLKSEISSLIKNMQLPKNIRIQPPGSLEGEGITFELPVRNTEDLKQSIQILKQLISNPCFNELLKKT
ncbi:MAG: ParB N-terminal domain-containing protein [bacterium]